MKKRKMSPVIEAIQLTKKYSQHKTYLDLFTHPFKQDKITALENINLKVNQGELFILIGPNGAGKTTLIKILCSLILPTRGRAYIKNYDVVKDSKKARSKIGFIVGEERSFYWRMTGKQNLEFFATLNNLPPKQINGKIQELLELVNLQNDANRLVKDYSAGMRQKLAIARGLINDPEILFMDEPFKSLDPVIAQNLKRFTKKKIVEEKGKTVFLATHNLHEAEMLGDRIAIIHRGRIKILGALEEIRKESGLRYLNSLKLANPAQELLAKIKQLEKVKKIDMDIAELGYTSKVVELEIEANEREISELIEKIVLWGGKILSCCPKKVSLENIYSRIIDERN